MIILLYCYIFLHKLFNLNFHPMKSITSFVIVLLLMAFGLSPTFSYAQPGSLDLSFDNDGKATTAIGSGDAGYSVAIQSDGKIIVAGASWNGSNDDFALVRYNADGSLDNTFDNDGKVTTAIGNGREAGKSVAIQSDGKIVVAGYSDNGLDYDFALVRYNTNGSLDNTFDSDGKVTTAIGGSDDVGYSVIIQSDGKIVVAGWSDYYFALVRYNANGSMDNTFDSDGKVTTAIGSGDAGRSVVIQSDGKIVVAGESYNGSDYDFALVRYNTDGSLDNSFDNDGKVTTAIGSSDDVGYSVAIQSDEKIIVAGSSWNGSNDDFALIRYNTDGNLDNTFDSDGKVTTAIGSSNEVGKSAAIQSDGKIVVAGKSYNGSAFNFAVVRYNGNGSLDNSFDSDGKVTTDFGGRDDSDPGHSIFTDVYSVAIQSDGKIVVVGYTTPLNSGSVFSIVRYMDSATITGIASLSLDQSISIFPNPGNGIFTIQCPVNISELEILNAFGEKCIATTVNNLHETVNLSSQPNGIYFLQLKTDQGVLNKKIILQK
jgi:uncharacterized delta-60 repeat protein